MFWDMHVRYSGTEAQNRAILEAAIEHGYDGIVWTQYIKRLTTSHKCDITPVELPSDAVLAQQRLLRLHDKNHSDFQQLTRAHLTIEDQKQTHGLTANIGILRQFDIISCSTSSAKMFHFLCTQSEVDIVCLDFSSRLNFFLKFPPVKAAIERGICFEVTYSKSIMDKTARRNLISNMQQLLRVCKGSNIILSSAASNALGMRNPYDVINLSMMFGLNWEQGRNSISSNAARAIIRGRMRRTHKATVELLPTTTTSAAENQTNSMDTSEE